MKFIQEDGKLYKVVESKEEIDVEAIIEENETLKKSVEEKKDTGNWNTGNRNTGDRNTGNWNTGNWNTGYRNTGNWNTGDRNTGNWNTGDRNTGNWNTGDRNTGNWNTGNWNTGDMNTGDRNTGNWNTGNWNTGYFCTLTQKASFFGKQTDIEFGSYDFPDFFYFDLTTWIYADYMSDEEKKDNPSWETTGGYLKVTDYKTAWRNAWDKAELSERKKVLDLPNFDNAMFLEITGIDAEKELK